MAPLTFTKNGMERIANTPAEAVALRYAGWRELEPPAHEHKAKASKTHDGKEETDGDVPAS